MTILAGNPLSESGRSRAVSCRDLPRVAAVFLVTAVTLGGMTAPGWAKSKNDGFGGACTIRLPDGGARVPCDFYEHCLLDGGEPTTINGKGYCCHGSLCEGVPTPALGKGAKRFLPSAQSQPAVNHHPGARNQTPMLPGKAVILPKKTPKMRPPLKMKRK